MLRLHSRVSAYWAGARVLALDEPYGDALLMHAPNVAGGSHTDFRIGTLSIAPYDYSPTLLLVPRACGS